MTTRIEPNLTTQASTGLLRRIGRRSLIYLPTYGVWIALTFITLIPIWWMIVISARTRVELFGNPSLLIKSFYVENYLNVINDRVYQGYM
ncbi:MAG: hypothetical protein K8J31_12500, partial [Anaerolineae bacterium]|nr:hypothetical protein [Anaerolineae bacterium]